MDHVNNREHFHDWLPIRMLFREHDIGVDWAHVGGIKFTAPFFRETVGIAMRLPFNQGFRRETSADEMVRWTDQHHGVEPTAFIFHASRCGSTLMGQMLAALPTHIVMSEPPMLDTILRAHCYLPHLDRNRQIAYTQALVRCLAQPRHGETKFVVKLDAWDIFELPLLREAFPATPWIFLYRDPLEIAVSQLRQRGAYLVPGVFGNSQTSISVEDALAMGEEHYVARMMGMILQEAARLLPIFNGVAVHYNQLPGAMWSDLMSLFGVDDNAATIEKMQHAAKWDAKNPYAEFVGDSESKQREASTTLREAIAQWAAAHYDALEKFRLQ